MERWARELEQSLEADFYELVLVGTPGSPAVARIRNVGNVAVPPPRNLNLAAFQREAAHRLARFLEAQSMPSGSASHRETLVGSLMCHMATLSTKGKPLTRDELVNLLTGLLLQNSEPSPEAWNVLDAYIEAERRCTLNGLRFPPPRLRDELVSGKGTATNSLVEDLGVPFRVLTEFRVSDDDNAAFREEQQRLRASNDDDSHVPPAAEERRRTESREVIQQFDDTYRQWLGTQDPLVILGDPGYGKSWLVTQLTLRMLEQLVQNPTFRVLDESDSQTADDSPAFLPLRVTFRELGDRLRSGWTLPDVVEEIVTDRLRRWSHDIPSANAIATFRKIVRDSFDEGRVFMLLDGWDERDQAHESVLLDVIRGWASSPCRLLGPSAGTHPTRSAVQRPMR